MNPIFTAMGGNPAGGMGALLQKYQQFRQTVTGDPQQIIQQMMQRGQVNPQQIAQAQQMARQMGMLK